VQAGFVAQRSAIAPVRIPAHTVLRRAPVTFQQSTEPLVSDDPANAPGHTIGRRGGCRRLIQSDVPHALRADLVGILQELTDDLIHPSAT
jgi:hypothetical protein